MGFFSSSFPALQTIVTDLEPGVRTPFADSLIFFAKASWFFFPLRENLIVPSGFGFAFPCMVNSTSDPEPSTSR